MLIGYASHGHGKEVLTHIERCLDKGYRSIMAILFAFCRIVAIQGLDYIDMFDCSN
jgi:hypothetical protein